MGTGARQNENGRETDGTEQLSHPGKVVVVAGSSQGIGRGLAVGLAREGAKVAINGRKMEKLETVAREIEERGGEVFPYPADLRDFEQVSAMMQRVKERFGRIDVLINNAGGSFSHNLEDLSPNGFDAVVRNNLHQVFYCCSAVRPIMAEQGGRKNYQHQFRRRTEGHAGIGRLRGGQGGGDQSH